MKKLTQTTLVLLLVIFGTGCQLNDDSQQLPDFSEIHKIDIHSHIYEEIPGLVELLENQNARIVNIANRGMEDHVEIQQEIAHELFQKYPNLFPYASTFDLTEIGEPGYNDSVMEWLDYTFDSGAVMVKIWKEIGMELVDETGEYIMPDDPVFDPVYRHLAERNIPLLAHVGDPIDGWLPLDPESVHYGYFSQNPEWHLYGRDDIPGHEDIIRSRDNMLDSHPELVVIGAHLGSLEHDVEEVVKRLDQYPNFYVEVSARTRDLTRQPREKVRQFFLDYPDRILYGVDVVWRPYRTGQRPDEEKVNFVNRYEERLRLDFQYYAGTDSIEYAGQTVKGLGLPTEVLEKFYSENAIRLLGIAE
jgi:predicted TIM-barrel fold metal-dependent hydrolase